MSNFRVVRPGITLLGSEEFSPVVPNYPFHYTEPKVGDTVWVIVESEEEWAIDSDTIVEIVDYYEESVRTYEYRQQVLRGEIEHPMVDGEPVDFSEYKNAIPPDPSTKEDYLIDFWIDKYNPGYGLDFGSCLYRSFEEARSVLVQYYADDHDYYLKILNSSAEELKPTIEINS